MTARLTVVVAALGATVVALAHRIVHERRAAERARLTVARELHDDVLPELAAAGLLLDLAHADPASLDSARRIISDSAARIRARTVELVAPQPAPPSTHAAADPATAFADLVESVCGPGHDVAVELATDVPERALTLLRRVAGELLRNAVVHGRAEHVGLRLSDADGLRLEVTDDGVGFDADRDVGADRLGLLLVRHQIADAGGTLALARSLGGGTTALVTLPFTARRAPARPRRSARRSRRCSARRDRA